MWNLIWHWLSDPKFILALVSAIAAWVVSWYYKPCLEIKKPTSIGRSYQSKCVIMDMYNVGGSTVTGCHAQATAIPVSPGGDQRIRYLHWADTDEQNVDIEAGKHKRLDVVFTESNHGCWLASLEALNNKDLNSSDRGDALLNQGIEYQLKIRITANGGRIKETSVLHLIPPWDWDRLDAGEVLNSTSWKWWRFWKCRWWKFGKTT